MLRRRGVGLLGTMAVGGAAYAAGSSMARRSAAEQAQNQQIAELQTQAAYAAPPAPTPAPVQPAGTSMDEKLAQLQQLAEMKNSGLLSEEEFATQKARILAS